MRRGAKIFFSLIFFCFLIVAGLVFLGVRALRQPPEIRDDSVLEVRIEGELLDGPVTNPIRGLFGGVPGNLYDIRRAIDAAAGDRRIRAVLLRIGLNDVGWGGAEELRDALLRLRKANKPLYGLMASDFVDDKNYYIATPATEISINPDSGLMINGLYAEAAFFRGAMDKLYIKPDYIQFKEYKSAAEPFIRKDMSPQYRESLEFVIRDIEDRFVQAVAEGRRKTPQEVREVMDSGLMTGPEAKQRGWVDTLGYWTDLEKKLDPSSGNASSDSEKSRIVPYSDYLENLDASAEGEPSIGVIFASGEIIAGHSDPWNQIVGSETMAGYLRDLRKDRSIKAIILRVNSPGGSAVGSDIIWREVREARAAGKPVVVSMGDLAASGGYYISMAADSIVAQPSTITGSIGVVFGKLNMRGFFEWLGVTFDSVQTSRNANLFSFVDSLTPEQEERIRAWMGQVYNDFVAKAAEGRKKPFDAIEPVAHGRIWSGKQAMERQLVDTLGGFNEAEAQARKLARIGVDEKVRFVIYPKRKGLVETLRAGDFPLIQDAATFLMHQTSKRLSVLDPGFLSSLQEARLWLIAPDVRIQ